MCAAMPRHSRPIARGSIGDAGFVAVYAEVDRQHRNPKPVRRRPDGIVESQSHNLMDAVRGARLVDYLIVRFVLFARSVRRVGRFRFRRPVRCEAGAVYHSQMSVVPSVRSHGFLPSSGFVPHSCRKPVIIGVIAGFGADRPDRRIASNAGFPPVDAHSGVPGLEGQPETRVLPAVAATRGRVPAGRPCSNASPAGRASLKRQPPGRPVCRPRADRLDRCPIAQRQVCGSDPPRPPDPPQARHGNVRSRPLPQ